jgi:hypothetical protein
VNKAEANRLLRASDAYPAWTRLVSRAQEQVTVFAPYLDDLLLKMLAHRRPRLRIPAVVVTTLGPTSVLEPSQLRTIRRALDAGIAVLSLPTLHAKVLLVDDRYVILGSQNFTSHGRQAILPFRGRRTLRTKPMHYGTPPKPNTRSTRKSAQRVASGDLNKDHRSALSRARSKRPFANLIPQRPTIALWLIRSTT